MTRPDRDNDPFVWWIVSGLIGAAAQDIIGLLAKFTGIVDSSMWNIAASLAIAETEGSSIGILVVGCMVDAVIGGMLGIVIGLLLEWRGTRDYMVKGLAVGLLAWVGFYVIVYHNLPFTASRAVSDAPTMILSFVGHAVYGLVAVTVYVRWLSKYARPRTQ